LTQLFLTVTRVIGRREKAFCGDLPIVALRRQKKRTQPLSAAVGLDCRADAFREQN
jgi:hypothetical protein